MNRANLPLLCFFLLLGNLRADDAADAGAAAQKFTDGYLRALNSTKPDDTTAYLEKNPMVTREYKKALAKFYRDALKKDPGYGYGADAVIWGNSWSESGYQVRRVWIAGPLAFVFLSTRNPEETFAFEARLVKVDGKWMLDGTGQISGGVFEAAAPKVSDDALTKLMPGRWHSPRHDYVYRPDGTWQMLEGEPHGTWTIKNGRLMAHTAGEKPSPLDSQRIYALNDSFILSLATDGTAFRMERVK